MVLWSGLLGLFVLILAAVVWSSVSSGEGVPWKMVAYLVLVGVAGPIWLIRRHRVPPGDGEQDGDA